MIAWRGLAPRPVPVAAVLRRLDDEGRAIGATAARPAGPAWLARLGARGGARRAHDLAIVGRTPSEHGREQVMTAVALAAIATALGVVLISTGTAPSAALVALAVLAAAGGGLVVADLTLRSTAQARRRAMRHALCAYLDLVNVLLAGGAGIETALEAAAGAGDGPAFALLRDELVRSRSLRRSPWDGFAELGERLGVAELTDLAASVRLAGEHGARIRTSLIAKATSLRERELAQIEADAQAATERMGLPTVLLFVGFVLLLGYPAVHLIATGW
jgi:Flp pilus assembly protein TadB